MSRGQKIVVAIGSGVAVLMMLFPPIYNIADDNSRGSSTHYISLVSSNNIFAYFETMLDFGRLALQLSVVIAVTVVGCAAFRNSRQSIISISEPKQSVNFDDAS